MRTDRFQYSLYMVWGICYFAVGTILAQDKAIGITQAIPTTSEGGQRWALIVGINEYTNLSPLRYARQDAEQLAL